MRKMAFLVIGTLLIASNVFAGNAGSLDANAIAKTILNAHKASTSEKGSFAIVYGGQDISHSVNAATLNPTLIG